MSATVPVSTEPPKFTAPCRDKNFYFDNGDYIIQAEDHLFKIHRFLLERDSQIFKDLFSLPQPLVSPCEGVALEEGKHDDNPLVFQDSADDFRALCWALYAKPNDILKQQNSTTVDLARMVKLLMISHKYGIRYLWDWSLKVIRDYSSSIPKKLMSSCGSWSEAERLLNLSNHCPDAAFISQHIEEEWLRKIQNSNFIEAREAFIAALDVSERSPNLYHFHTKAYHTYVKTIGKPHHHSSSSSSSSSSSLVVDMNDSTTLVDLTTLDLGDLRTIRLYRGFWSLSQLRLKLSVAPKIDDNHSCNQHANVCVPAWTTWWEKEMQANILDPGELIQAMLNRACSSGITRSETTTSNNPPSTTGSNVFRIERSSTASMSRSNTPWGSLPSAPPTPIPCSTKIISQLQGMMKNFNNTLGDHFMLPRP